MSYVNLNAIEQTQEWRQPRVDGVERPKFDFHAAIDILISQITLQLKGLEQHGLLRVQARHRRAADGIHELLERRAVARAVGDGLDDAVKEKSPAIEHHLANTLIERLGSDQLTDFVALRPAAVEFPVPQFPATGGHTDHRVAGRIVYNLDLDI